MGRIETFGHKDGIGEGIDIAGRVVSKLLSSIGGKADPEIDAQLLE